MGSDGPSTLAGSAGPAGVPGGGPVGGGPVLRSIDPLGASRDDCAPELSCTGPMIPNGGGILLSGHCLKGLGVAGGGSLMAS